MTKSRMLSGLLLAAVAAALPATAFGTDIWLEPDRGDEIRLEVTKPSFDHVDLSTFTAMWRLSGRVRVGERAFLNADLPYAHFAPDGASEYSSNAVGNPYLGVQYVPGASGFSSDFGVRVPLAPDDEEAAFLATYADFVDNAEAYLPKVMSFMLGLGYESVAASGVGVRLRVAPVLWIDTGDVLADGSELYLRYSAQVFQRQGSVSVGAGLSGRYLATEDAEGGFGERSWHELDFYCNLDLTGWRPSLRVRVPLDSDLTELLDPCFVLGVGVPLH